jgi:large subunit ribosomal protein L6
MSKIGRKPVPVPPGVKADVKGRVVSVKGNLGSMDCEVPDPLTVEIEEGAILVGAPSDAKEHRAIHGLARSLIANAVKGVSEGFEKALEIVGVGYNAKAEGRKLTLRIGFCHPVVVPIPEGVEAETPDPTKIVLKGCDKQLVGETAARIRKIRPPEPYKGKGIRYVGEHVRRKAGKTFVAVG